jgi:hypothetical protein
MLFNQVRFRYVTLEEDLFNGLIVNSYFTLFRNVMSYLSLKVLIIYTITRALKQLLLIIIKGNS